MKRTRTLLNVYQKETLDALYELGMERMLRRTCKRLGFPLAPDRPHEKRYHRKLVRRAKEGLGRKRLCKTTLSSFISQISKIIEQQE